MSVDYTLIGSRIRTQRKLYRKTQENLAEYLSVSVGYISQIERGVTKVSLDTLSNISSFLSCDITELISNVNLNQNEYMNEELNLKIKTLSARQKKLLLEIIEAVAKY